MRVDGHGSDPPVRFEARAESWPLAELFVIARGAKSAADVVFVAAHAAGTTGRGEAVPYARYGETVAGVLAAIETAASALAAHSHQHPAELRSVLQTILPQGAARNAIDCALWDLEAKIAGCPVSALAHTPPPQPCLTCYTLSLDTPERMAAKARAVGHLPLLKLKLGGLGDAERLRAVRAARPDARLVADANESWTVDLLPGLLAVAAETRIEVVEQPLPTAADGVLRDLPRPVPVCADESLHTRADLPAIAGRYDAINVKLDKAGGLTEALALAAEARAHGLMTMVGCMVATSLAMAPALQLAGGATWVDLDGPLLLIRDREPGLRISSGLIMPAPAALWG